MKLNRRSFLRGAGGVVVALPFLESLAPKKKASADGTRCKRFVVFFECNGVNMERIYPTTSWGALTDASFTGQSIEPLQPYKDKLLIPRGVHMVPMGFGQGNVPTVGCDHRKGMGHKLTAMPLQDTNDNYAQGPSVDQVIAAAVNPPNRDAMTLMVGPQGTDVVGSISYSAPGTPVIGENNPYLVYRDMMNLSPGTMPMDDPQALRRRSVLDLVRQEMQDLKAAGLSMADQQKLDMHYDAIRDVEMGMTQTGMVACTSLDTQSVNDLGMLDPQTIANDSEYKKVGQLQMRVMALALACNFTRVASIQWGRGSGGPIFTWDGMQHIYNHHKLSHGTTRDDGGETVAGYLDMLAAIDRWYMQQYKFLLDLLNAYDEGGFSVLDNSAVVYMNELSDGKGHDFRDLPYIIAGSCGGYFKQGQYIKLTARADDNMMGGWWDDSLDAPHNKLLTTFANAMGLNLTHFGHPDLPSGDYPQLRA